jgi:hypothetical protein
VVEKPHSFQKVPKVPNFDERAKQAVKYDGLPPLGVSKSSKLVVFTNVNNVYQRAQNGVSGQTITSQELANESGVVVVRDGRLICTGNKEDCINAFITEHDDVDFIDLEGGSISPALTSFGSPLGLEEINQEDSTNDGAVIDQLKGSVPNLIASKGAVIRALDGLEFGTRNALYVAAVFRQNKC